MFVCIRRKDFYVYLLCMYIYMYICYVYVYLTVEHFMTNIKCAKSRHEHFCVQKAG